MQEKERQRNYILGRNFALCCRWSPVNVVNVLVHEKMSVDEMRCVIEALCYYDLCKWIESHPCVGEIPEDPKDNALDVLSIRRIAERQRHDARIAGLTQGTCDPEETSMPLSLDIDELPELQNDAGDHADEGLITLPSGPFLENNKKTD